MSNSQGLCMKLQEEVLVAEHLHSFVIIVLLGNGTDTVLKPPKLKQEALLLI